MSTEFLRRARVAALALVVLTLLVAGLTLTPSGEADAHPGPHNHYPVPSSPPSNPTSTAVPGDGGKKMSPRQRWICHTGCAAGFIGGIVVGGPIFGGVVGMSCATACETLNIVSGVFDKSFVYRATVNPASRETWQQATRRFERAVQSVPIEQDQVTNVRAFLREVSDVAHRLVPDSCYVQGRFSRGRGACERWNDVQRAADAIAAIDVRATSSGNSWKPRGHFVCEGRRYYSGSDRSYRMLGDNGRQHCPGVDLILHVYRDGKVIESIPPANGGGGSGGGFSDGLHPCHDLRGKPTGRTYYINGPRYWQTTGPSNIVFCPELREAGMTFEGWAWPTGGDNLVPADMSATGVVQAIDVSWKNIAGSSGVGIYIDGRYWGWVPTHEANTKRIPYGTGTFTVEVKAANPDGTTNHISLGTSEVVVTDATLDDPGPEDPIGPDGEMRATGASGGIDVSWTNVAGSSGVGIHIDGRYWGWVPTHDGSTKHVPYGAGNFTVEVKAANPDGTTNQISLGTAYVTVTDGTDGGGGSGSAMNVTGTTGGMNVSWTNIAGSSGVGIYVDGRYWGWVPAHEGTTQWVPYGAGNFTVEVKAANPDGTTNHISLGTADVTVS